VELSEINPFVRFAAGVYKGVLHTTVKVTDCRIFYVQEGEAELQIGENTFHLIPGSLFYCCGGSTYQVKSLEPLGLICINFDLNRSNNRFDQPFPVCSITAQWPQMRVHYDPVEDSSFLGSHLFLEKASWLYTDIQELVSEFGEDTPFSKILCGSLLKSLLLRLHRARQQMPSKLAVVQEHIRRHYKESLTNKQLGQLVGYHEYYLNRAFCAFTGVNLHEYLVKIRMERAAQLIRNTQLPFGVVAEEVGIRSYPHFSSCFRKYWGCSPAKYRQQHT